MPASLLCRCRLSAALLALLAGRLVAVPQHAPAHAAGAGGPGAARAPETAPSHPDLELNRAGSPGFDGLVQGFEAPPATARPWVFWYWMHGAVSREGITADLEAMRDAGIGGACLVSIKSPDTRLPFSPVAPQLSPLWWELVSHALLEARRCGLRLSMPVSDGFATAGGPWITPELSMQRLAWSRVDIPASAPRAPVTLPAPAAEGAWFRDLRVLAFPTPGVSLPPPLSVSVSGASSLQAPAAEFFAGAGGDREFRSEQPCSLTLDYGAPQLVRSVNLRLGGGAYQSNRLLLEASDDGVAFRTVSPLEAPRHGWFDSAVGTTHGVPATTARWFRLSWTPAGSEPGGEDLDSAKWKPVLKLRGLSLSSAPVVHHVEGKNGSAWRLASSSGDRGLRASDCVSAGAILELTDRLLPDGRLDWVPHEGAWTVLRVASVSTGTRNETGGAARGLECDKLNAAAVRLQWDHWFALLLARSRELGAGSVLDTVHVDSWECGSQNWSPVLPPEFLTRRGYSFWLYLPVLAGVPVISPEHSERFLHDYRQTLSELMVEKFYGTLSTLARENGLAFSGECTAPVMAADGLAHYAHLDVPMGEFWLRSPTHDKPNDIADSVSGARIYGRRLVQAEAFTAIRAGWDEHPGLLKTLGDRHFALGVNRLLFHVWAHNPWLDRKPGMTLDRIGTFLQRDQVWWPLAPAWTSYLSRSQFLLQQGAPVSDIAVFTGEQLPSRSVLPGRLISTLPGLIGPERVAREQARLRNEGQPRRTLPATVTASANLSDSADWLDPLGGYAFDSINPDAFLRLARVENARLVLPGGASYGLLVLPRQDPLRPSPRSASLAFLRRLRAFVQAGLPVVLNERPTERIGLQDDESTRAEFLSLVDELWGPAPRLGAHASAPARASRSARKLGSGLLFDAPWQEPDLSLLGIPPAVRLAEGPLGRRGEPAAAPSGVNGFGVAWTQRRVGDLDLFYFSNQTSDHRDLLAALRTQHSEFELLDPVSGKRRPLPARVLDAARRELQLALQPGESLFVLSRPSWSPSLAASTAARAPETAAACQLVPEGEATRLEGPWSLRFVGPDGPESSPLLLSSLVSWTDLDEERHRHHSGSAVYEKELFLDSPPPAGLVLDLDRVADLASVELNGAPLGVVWTFPFSVDLAPGLRPGRNLLRIQVYNTWANRLIGDHAVPSTASTYTSAPWLLEGRAPLPAGLLGPVTLRRLRPSPPASAEPPVAASR